MDSKINLVGPCGFSPSHRLAGLFAAVLFFLAGNQAGAELVGYWNFNENTGLTAFDLSDKHNDGTLTAIGGGSVPVWVDGHTEDAEDFALRFDQGFVRVTDSASLHIANRFTLGAWMYDTGSNYGHLFVAGDGGAGGRNWLLQTSNFGGDAAYFWSATNSGFQQNLDFVPTQNSWHHIALTYDGSNIRSYFDGVLRSTKPTTATLSAWGTFRLGGFSVFGSGFQGFLDDMVIFDTVEDVGQIMAGTHPAMAPDAPFAITEISLDGNLLSVSWTSVENEFYFVKFSHNLIEWTGELDDAAKGEPGAQTTSGTYDLTNYDIDVGTVGKLFVRVEKIE